MLEHKEGEKQLEENYSDQLEKHVVTSLYYRVSQKKLPLVKIAHGKYYC